MNINYSYLRPPPHTKNFQHSNDYIMKVQNGIHKRKIFYDTDFDIYELSEIEKLKQLLKKSGIQHDYSQAQLLKFCYAAQFKLLKAIEKINLYRQWETNPQIKNLSEKARQILQTGIFYTYGRDYQYRPIIILNIARIDLKKYTIEDCYCAFHHLTIPIKKFMLLDGKIQNWNVIIETEEQIKLPIDNISDVIQKISTVYCGRLQRLFVINLNTALRAVYTGLKSFIPEQIQKKIEILGPKQTSKIFKYLPQSEVEKKFGGHLENLDFYWPIRTTGKIFHEQSASKVDIQIEESQYQSIDNNQQYFKVEQNSTGCCGDEKCVLF